MSLRLRLRLHLSLHLSLGLSARPTLSAPSSTLLPHRHKCVSSCFTQVGIPREWFRELQLKDGEDVACPQCAEEGICCPKFLPPPDKFEPAPPKIGKMRTPEGLHRKCHGCGHMHVQVKSFSDLTNRSVMQLVAH